MRYRFSKADSDWTYSNKIDFGLVWWNKNAEEADNIGVHKSTKTSQKLYLEREQSSTS